MKQKQDDDDYSDRARFIFWKHLQLFKYVWSQSNGSPQTGATSGLQWIQFHERFCTEHHVRDPLLQRVFAEFIQHISDTGRWGTADEIIVITWNEKFDKISMTDDEIQGFAFRYIVARRELFHGITNDVAANREVLRKVVAEKIPGFLKQAYSFASPIAIKEYLEASR